MRRVSQSRAKQYDPMNKIQMHETETLDYEAFYGQAKGIFSIQLGGDSRFSWEGGTVEGSGCGNVVFQLSSGVMGVPLYALMDKLLCGMIGLGLSPGTA